MNYFTLFEIPVSLKVDSTAILKKYYQLNRQYHPDNFTLSDKKMQDESEKMSTLINQAKFVLDHPYRRLEYILKVNEIIEEDEKYNLPSSFLGEMMELNEELMDLEFDIDSEKLSEVKKQVEAKEDELMQEIQPFFEQDELALTPENAAKLKDYYYKKKYLQRIIERILKMS